MDPLNQNKVSPKLLLIIGGLLLLLIVVFSALSLSKKSNQSAANKQGENQLSKEQQTRLSQAPTPTFIPPPNYSYSTVDSVNFLPHSINNYTIDQDKIIKTAKQIYPNLSGAQFVKQIDEDIFTWLALNEFYQTADVTKVSAAYAVNSIENMSVIHKDIAAVSNNYNSNVMKIGGFYMKLQYKGTLPQNLKKLKRTEKDLQPLASQLINKFHSDALKNPFTTFDSFNKNNTVILMNNRQASIKFDNYPVYPPLVSDVNYYDMIKSLPLGRVSDVITLHAKLRGSSAAQDYAYIIFYLADRKGTNIPIDALANAYVAKSKIK
jgi:hypothetical protein